VNSDHESAAPLPELPMERPKPGSWIKNIFSLIAAFLIVFSIKSAVVEPFKIPSGSMIPTLFVGDHIFVNKLAYGLRVPLTDWFGNGIYLTRWSQPKRGDIVVFRFPKNMTIFYIKRIVGVPGDEIELRDKFLYVNGNKVDRKPVAAELAENTFKALAEPERFSANNIEMFYESVPSNDGTIREHMMMTDKNHYIGENQAKTRIPENSFFVMGDNRDFSNDSRFWGFVPAENITGRASMIWMSFWPDFQQMKFTFHNERAGTFLK